ncbi:MAG: hypothetical protein AAGG11_20485 [Pseudomonadota bacterium]
MAKRNGLLIAGIALPGIVVLLFFAYIQLARQTVAPPAYDLLYAHHDYRQYQPEAAELRFSVTDGRLQIHALRSTAPYRSSLYRWHHASGRSERIPIELPEALSDTPRLVPAPTLTGLRLSPDIEAPDGYRFDTGASRGPGLIGALFSQRRRTGTIHKLGVAFAVPPPDGTERYWAPQFLGWVIPDE